MEYVYPKGMVQSVESLLSAPLSGEQLVELDAVRPGLLEARCESMRYLHFAEGKLLHPKDKDLTELDRRIRLQSGVVDMRRDYEYLKGLEELVKDRVNLGKVLYG